MRRQSRSFAHDGVGIVKYFKTEKETFCPKPLYLDGFRICLDGGGRIDDKFTTARAVIKCQSADDVQFRIVSKTAGLINNILLSQFDYRTN